METTGTALAAREAAPIAASAPRPLAQWIFAPATQADAWDFAERLAKSDLVPKELRGRPADILIVLQMSAEVGLSPAQALQGTAIINGRPGLFGTTLLAVVLAHPSIDDVVEELPTSSNQNTATCTVTRYRPNGKLRATTRSFSLEDAMVAGLTTKEGPWQQFRARMLMMRARSFAIDDSCADILHGMGMIEVLRDIPGEHAVVDPADGIRYEREPGQSKSSAIASTLETISASTAGTARTNVDPTGVHMEIVDGGDAVPTDPAPAVPAATAPASTVPTDAELAAKRDTATDPKPATAPRTARGQRPIPLLADGWPDVAAATQPQLAAFVRTYGETNGIPYADYTRIGLGFGPAVTKANARGVLTALRDFVTARTQAAHPTDASPAEPAEPAATDEPMPVAESDEDRMYREAQEGAR